MRVVTTVKAVRRLIAHARSQKKTVGFVPTMGFLHQGHASLMRQSAKDNDITVLSIFVNPRQFGPDEDLKVYPRDIKKDEKLAKKENVDIIFYPSVDEIYPSGYSTYVEVEGYSEVLCGRSRPSHFKGVTTIVAKLINIVSPHQMYLGQKDAQQALIVRKMVQDLNWSLKVKVLPTVREADGLAMSSRNSYLTPQERKEAVILYRSLLAAKQKIQTGEQSVNLVLKDIRTMIQKNSQGVVDYIECVDAKSLKTVEEISSNVLIALAVWFGRARLIDNVIVKTHER